MPTILNLSILPPMPVTTSLIASASFLLYLIIFSHRPVRFIEEQRFQAATIASISLWIILLWLTGALSPVETDLILNILAGCCIIAGALIIWWTFWTQIAWGFRLTMLVNLDAKQRPILIDDWIDEYGGGRGKEGLLASRVGMLLKLRWATRQGNCVTLTPGWGENSARIVHIFRRLFALEDNP